MTGGTEKFKLNLLEKASKLVLAAHKTAKRKVSEYARSKSEDDRSVVESVLYDAKFLLDFHRSIRSVIAGDGSVASALSIYNDMDETAKDEFLDTDNIVIHPVSVLLFYVGMQKDLTAMLLEEEREVILRGCVKIESDYLAAVTKKNTKSGSDKSCHIGL